MPPIILIFCMTQSLKSALENYRHEFIYSDLNSVEGYHAQTTPYCIKILLENLLRHQEDGFVTEHHIQALTYWNRPENSQKEIPFSPARVLLQDFTGVPLLVDLALMRDAIAKIGGDPLSVNPIKPLELVVDHSIMVDSYASPEALSFNSRLDYERNRERYTLFKWAQHSFENMRVVPPHQGIVHQVNLEYLARVLFVEADLESPGNYFMYPDTVVGTDSHTTMVNGLGVLGWGVGGIEAEAAALGQPIPLKIPKVIGVNLSGALKEGVTATDLVLAVTKKLREYGVVECFVELFGPSYSSLSLSDRATIANMSPEFGSTCVYCPWDDETLRYMALTGRSEAQRDLLKEYAVEQHLFYDAKQAEHIQYTDVVAIDLSAIEPALAGPKRPQDRQVLSEVPASFRTYCEQVSVDAQQTAEFGHGSVAIAAITSCTNTSNPSVMIAAGLVARKARALGLTVPSWVKTSLAPGSKVVHDYLEKSGLLVDLEALGFHIVGYGCTTCIGNSGPLCEDISCQITEKNLNVCAVLSGNRNFEGRIHPQVQSSYLASPPLVVAYALSGTVLRDLTAEPLAHTATGQPVFLKDLWPSSQEIAELEKAHISKDIFKKTYEKIFEGDQAWQQLQVEGSACYPWKERSSYLRAAPYFEGFTLEPAPVQDLVGARALAILGNSVTTDHISPAGDIPQDTPAGRYLQTFDILKKDFNSYGARRGNHEVMSRGTFANIRLKNKMVAPKEGGWTRYWPEGQECSIFESAQKYQQDAVPLLIIAGTEYGSGSSRDWAAKGPMLLGVRAVIAQSFERIHRSNLIGMGIVPLEFLPSEHAQTYHLDGSETFSIAFDLRLGILQEVQVLRLNGEQLSFHVTLRVDSPTELEYIKHGGILPYMVRQLHLAQNQEDDE